MTTERRGKGPTGTQKPEESDDRVAVSVRGPGQQERQAGPKHGEGGERQTAVRRAQSQLRFGTHQMDHGGEQFAVDEPWPCILFGQGAGQESDKGEDDHAGRHVHRPPTGDLGDESRKRPGQQDPDQQTTHNGTHDPPAVHVISELGTERDQDLGGDGTHSGYRRRPDEESGGGQAAMVRALGDAPVVE